MKAAVIPEVNGRWELREVPTPQPGPGEVLMRVRASGVCVNDVLATTGAIRFPSVDPAITGHEPAGEVVAVGPGSPRAASVTGWEPTGYGPPADGATTAVRVCR